MLCITGSDIIKATGGLLLQGDPGLAVSGFSIDTRSLQEGDFFVPLKGEREDGHTYLAEAIQKGAAGSFFSLKQLPPLPAESLIIGVADTLKALQQTAAAYRRRFKLPVVGITGSSGKTTTKDLVAGVLSTKLKILKTSGNLNNEIGLPLTLLELNDSHQGAVLEMGMSAPGEIAVLAELARPSIGVITNIGLAHIESLGSVEAIARAKGELLDYMGAGGTAVLNGDDPRLREMGRRFPGKVYYYGFSGGDFQAVALSYRGEGSRFQVRFPDGEEYPFGLLLPGRHLAGNALAAITVGWLFELTPEQIAGGLLASELTGGRMQICAAASGARLIDDSYNANPGSVEASLQALLELSAGGRAVAVLGDMLELGQYAAAAHREIGRLAARSGISCLITVGELAAELAAGAKEEGAEVYLCQDHIQALSILRELPLANGWYVLVKGSRAMKMERIVQALREK